MSHADSEQAEPAHCRGIRRMLENKGRSLENAAHFLGRFAPLKHKKPEF